MTAHKIANIVWWVLYCILGLGVQRFFPGVDALVPGVMISCQEGRPQQTGWLCLIFMLIQEGTGSLDFGTALLWYTSLILLFFTSRLFFETGSLFFVVILSLALALAHAGIVYTTSSLQGVTLNVYSLAEQATAQALLIPPLYVGASLVRKRVFGHEYGF